MKKLFHIFIGLLIAAATSYPQSYSFQNITERDGLSENYVIDIFEDSWGFLWFVTPDAVNHYDGYKFKIFRNDPFDPNSISPGIITKLSEDAIGNIWIGTTRGLNKYDRLTNSFKKYSTEDGLSFHQITTLFKDSEGTFWVGMGDIIGRTNKGGLAYFDSTVNRFISLTNDTLDENSISNNHVTSIAEDNEGHLWIGTYDGLNKFDKLSKSFDRYYFNQNSDQENNPDKINDLFYDSNKNLWIATDIGLFRFDEQKEEFRKIVFSQNNNTESLRILTVYESPSDKGILWIGTDSGLYEYKIKIGSSEHYFKKEGDPKSLPSNKIQKILEDHSGILWFAAGNSGLAKLNRFTPNFLYINTDILSTIVSENNVYAIIQNHNGNLLAGTYESVVEVVMDHSGSVMRHRKKRILKRSQKLKDLLKQNRVVALYEDHFKRVWVGTSNNGIVIIDSIDVITHLSENSTDIRNKLQSNGISFITSNDGNNIWVGTKGGGLDRVDVETFKVTSYSLNDSIPNSTSNVLSYYFDGHGFMWVGTTRGLRKFDLNKNMFVPFEFESKFRKYIGNDMIFNFTKTKSNSDILWIGTFNSGLCKLNLATGEFKRYTIQNSGLPSNRINSLLDYGSSTIWISTNRGLVRFDSKNENIRIYSNDDTSENYQYNINSVFVDKLGRFCFGGTNGILHFDPSQVRKNLYLPRLVVTNLIINGKSIVKKGNKKLIKEIMKKGEIILSNDQNTIEIDFVALHYASPKNNQYEYQLINYNAAPIRTSEKREVVYNNLSPGNYKFILKAANADGIFASHEVTMNIIINPPLYKTWWAYLLYVLAGIGLFLIYRKYEINKQLEAARLKESELRAKQAELKAEAAASEAKVIQIENERKTKELEDARKLQLSMLPDKIPTSDQYEIAVYMKTASEVGGDYYDFSISEDGTLNIGFGDATGHGMQAGVLVSLIKGLFVSDSSDTDIATFMLKSNNTIKKSKLGRIMMAFSLLKLKDRTLQISSAGMPPIYIYSKLSNNVEEINLMGMPLGAMLNFPFKDIQIEVNSGDTILLISDGIPEMLNKDEEQFEYFRLSKLFKEVADKSPKEIIDAIVEISEEWLDGKPLEDDITLLVLKIK